MSLRFLGTIIGGSVVCGYIGVRVGAAIGAYAGLDVGLGYGSGGNSDYNHCHDRRMYMVP